MKVFKILCVIGLAALFLFSLAKLQKNITRFGNDGIQRDFAVYYTAGESLNRGFPLYKNGISEDPPIWDSAALYTYSRFIYPPLVAVPFGLMAKFMSYATAKFFWIYFSLACLIASLFITIRTLKLKLHLWQYLVIGIYASLFFPLLTFIALGQIDAVTLLVALVAITAAVSEKRRQIASGFLWAFATLIKLHIGLVIFFFMLRKQWGIIAGYLLGGATIIVLTALFLGPNALPNYLIKEFPRFAPNGENGPVEMRLPKSTIEQYYREHGMGHTSGLIKEGRWFKDVKISFSPNASLPRFIIFRMQGITENWQKTSPTLVSLILLVPALLVAYLGLKKIRRKIPQFSTDQEFLYWYAILTVILLVGPLTWAMTMIWIIPLVALAVGRNPWSTDKMQLVPWLMLVIALILAFVPDCMYFGWRNFDDPSWGCKMLDSSKYIIPELLIITSIWLQIGGTLLPDKIRNLRLLLKRKRPA